MSRPIGAAGRALLERWEQGPGGGPALRPYHCAAGILTVGYGHAIKPGERFEEITPEQAANLLVKDAQLAADAVDHFVTMPLTEAQRDALICFVFNVGVGAFIGSSLRAALNKGKYAEVPDQMRRWCHVKGAVCTGLVNRREAEIRLWSSASSAVGAAATGAASAPAGEEAASPPVPPASPAPISGPSPGRSA